MQAWQVHENGEPSEVMRLTETGRPVPGDGQVLLRVRAANVNFPDALLCRGQYQVRPPLPFTPGVEICGETEDGREGCGGRGVFVQRGEGLVAPGADGVGGEGVTGDVDGVDGLPGAGVPGVAACQFRVDRGERGADLLADGAGEAGRHLLLLTHPTPSNIH